jgi:hypothetical protein
MVRADYVPGDRYGRLPELNAATRYSVNALPIRLFRLNGPVRFNSQAFTPYRGAVARSTDCVGLSCAVMTTRRTFLIVGLAGGAALTAAYWLRRARVRDPVTGGHRALAALDPAAQAIVAAIAPVMLDGALPADPADRHAAVTETVANVARAVSGLAPSVQKEIGELFSLLGLPPTRVALAGVTTPWAEASPEAVAAFLERWRTSEWMLLRSAYDALHQLVLAAWYGNPRAWPSIGYPGPPVLA